MLKLIRGVSRGFAGFAGWLTIPMMLSVCLDAMLRGLFNIALLGITEINSLILVMMIYLGLAGAQNAGANFNVTLFVDHLSPRWQRINAVILNLICIATIGVLCWFCWKIGLSSYARGESTYGMFQMPIWPARWIVALGMTLLVLQLIADLFAPHLSAEDAEAKLSADFLRRDV